MDDMEITYYDAHIKAHERHILLQWLEDAKTEKIKKLKEEKIAVPTQKVVVPSPEITEETISYCQVFDNPNLDISGRLIIGKTQKSVSYMPTIDFAAIPGISKNKTTIPDRIGEYKTTIKSQMFSEIKIVDIPGSDNRIDTETTIDTKVFEGIKPVGIDIPEYSDLSEAFTVPDSFSISSIKSTIPTTVELDGVLAIDNDLFDSIKPAQPVFESVEIPDAALLNNNLFAGMIPQTSIDTRTPAKEKLVFNADLIQSINLKTISVPKQPENTDIHIEHELPSVIFPIPVSVIPQKTVLNTQLTIEDCNSISCPDVRVSEPMKIDTMEISSANNAILNDVVIPDEPEIQDVVYGFKMPEMQLPCYSIPSDSHIPNIAIDEITAVTVPNVVISASSIKISDDINNRTKKIDLPRMSDIETKPYIAIDEITAVAAPNVVISASSVKISDDISNRIKKVDLPKLSDIEIKPAGVSVSAPSIPLTNMAANSVSELSFGFLRILVHGIKTIIPDNGDILEILKKESNTYSSF